MCRHLESYFINWSYYTLLQFNRSVDYYTTSNCILFCLRYEHYYNLIKNVINSKYQTNIGINIITSFILTGVLIHYTSVMLTYWWLCLIGVTFYKLVFPFHTLTMSRQKRFKYVHIVLVIIGELIIIVMNWLIIVCYYKRCYFTTTWSCTDISS